MKPASFLCKIDNLGRILIPKPLRDKYDLRADDTFEIFTEPDALVLKKYGMNCIFCGSVDTLTVYKGRPICQSCLTKLQNL